MKNYIFFLLLFISACSPTTTNNTQKGFVKIKAGEYALGDSSSYVNPFHTYKTNGFAISETEITNQQFADFVKATNYKTVAEKLHNAMTFKVGLEEFDWYKDTTVCWRFPFGRSNGGIENKMNYAVTSICFTDALAYCKWANVRLPTADEWEIACRAGTRDKYFFGTDSTLISKYANIWINRKHNAAPIKDTFLFTAPVKSFEPNAWGIYDMYGNCFEFCEGKFINRKTPKNVVISRGGSWWCSKNSCNFFNSVDMGRLDKNASFSNNGFRVVKDND